MLFSYWVVPWVELMKALPMLEDTDPAILVPLKWASVQVIWLNYTKHIFYAFLTGEHFVLRIAYDFSSVGKPGRRHHVVISSVDRCQHSTVGLLSKSAFIERTHPCVHLFWDHFYEGKWYLTFSQKSLYGLQTEHSMQVIDLCGLSSYSQ